jgi:hypothetical protein
MPGCGRREQLIQYVAMKCKCAFPQVLVDSALESASLKAGGKAIFLTPTSEAENMTSFE